MKITIGEVADPDSRFPRIYIQIGRNRYLFAGTDASTFGKVLADAARSAVARVDIDVLRPIVLEIEVTPS